jgi:putative SOS response-associated peptidase YedK
MCNLYSMNRTRDEVRVLIGALRDLTANQAPLPGIYPDYQAPIVRVESGRSIVANARWGPPSPAFALQGRNSDSGITNVRNTSHATESGGPISPRRPRGSDNSFDQSEHLGFVGLDIPILRCALQDLLH